MTAGTSVTLPDLSPFGASYGTNAYTWQTYAFRFDGFMEGDVDQTLEPGSPSLFPMFLATIFAAPPSDAGYVVSGPKRSFTVH